MHRESSDRLAFEDGELIYQQGDVGNVMYVLREGSVRITRQDSHGEILLATLGPGEFFGEMSLLSGGRRSATVTAESHVALEIITRSAFMEHVTDPLAKRVLVGLSDRLRKVDSLLEYLHVERLQIRQDAHDRVYNRLAALSQLVDVAGAEAGREPHAHDAEQGDRIALPEIAADIRRTVSELQQILGERSSVDPTASVAHDDMIGRLEGVCSALGDIWQMKVRLRCGSRLPSLPHAMCWDLECILEEALNNSAKHGEASWVHVLVETHDRENQQSVRMSIVDDGLGMSRVPDLSELPVRSKGLRSMHSRVQSYGGLMELDSTGGKTALSVLIPVGSS
jgi:CRP-like cAMP-binding protein